MLLYIFQTSYCLIAQPSLQMSLLGAICLLQLVQQIPTFQTDGQSKLEQWQGLQYLEFHMGDVCANFLITMKHVFILEYFWGTAYWRTDLQKVYKLQQYRCHLRSTARRRSFQMKTNPFNRFTDVFFPREPIACPWQDVDFAQLKLFVWRSLQGPPLT